MIKFQVLSLLLVILGFEGSLAIIGGHTAKIQDHPYMVAIEAQGEFICSGALITNTSVVTAASCFNRTDNIDTQALVIRVGAQFREGGGETYNLLGYDVNPNYDVEGSSDVLILHVEREVVHSKEMAPVQMADPSVGFNDGDTVIITGYGDTALSGEASGDAVGQLHSVALIIFDTSLCGSAVYDFKFDDTRSCAGGWEAKGVCGKNDLGSPIVNWLGQLVGMTTKQLTACSIKGVPTVFQNLLFPDVYDWVQNMTGLDGL